MDHPYLNNQNQMPFQNIPQYPQAYPQYPNNNTGYSDPNYVYQPNPNYGYEQNPNFGYQQQISPIIPPNYNNTTVDNFNNQPSYDQIRTEAQANERRNKIRKYVIGLVVILVIIGTVLAIVLPIVLTSSGSTLYYQLDPGYSFTGNSNCTFNFTIQLNWTNSGTDLDLLIVQPGGEQVLYSDRNGRYGNHQGDAISGPAKEQYKAPCARTGQFQIKVRHYGSSASATNSPLIIVTVNSVGNVFSKIVPWIDQDSSYHQSVAKFVISQNANTRNWNFKLV